MSIIYVLPCPHLYVMYASFMMIFTVAAEKNESI